MSASSPEQRADAGLLLNVTGLTKSFRGVAALVNGRFDLRPGSVHALCGGNGAGKSTFLSIIMGIHQRDGGVVRLRGREVDFANPAEALAAGISIIEQELSPVSGLTIAENIFLGREPLTRFGTVDFATMNRRAKVLLDELGFELAPQTPMGGLSVAQIQLVEIAKALGRDAEIIIMDEPTSAVGVAEADHLFAVIRRLKARGKGIIYVSHRLTEVFDIADDYTVFRDGAYIDSGAMADISRNDLIRMIAGRELAEEYVKTSTPGEHTILSVTGLHRPGRLTDINLDLRKGEILGLYGLMGAGRTEILECLFGLYSGWTGRIDLDGKQTSIATVQDAMAAGFGLVTEDRKQSGLIMHSSVRSNISLAILPTLTNAIGVVDKRRETSLAKEMISRFRIRTASDQLAVTALSGGNQQKVVMGRWHLTKPRILLLDEPTRGVDVGAKREIYALMSEFAQAGGSIIMVSSEVEEVLGMSDRIMVIRDGQVSGTVARADANQETLLHLAA
ncbi:sugar ABC transporter ATP-binding protein [Shinella zoogloeoides]|uniref:sugar ABC transporter ATP-binding protein n=1 Tax=Shinella zoogloeoides TaxID=352475 RepID=UPI0028A86815|nr:sugar ABC transporter ATP-binding protein [Shinella zoogloeoides]